MGKETGYSTEHQLFYVSSMIQRQTETDNADMNSAKKPGKVYWRSLDQLLGKAETNDVIDHDFGAAAPPPAHADRPAHDLADEARQVAAVRE